jgi:preprotein translocase subunit SecA
VSSTTAAPLESLAPRPAPPIAERLVRFVTLFSRREDPALEGIKLLLKIHASASDTRLRERTEALRTEAADATPRSTLPIEAIALIAETVRRVHGLTPYDVQLRAGLKLAKGYLAEMATGEGKTLVALLAAFHFALAGRGVHVATVNPYLAQRDAEFARPVFERLGLTVGLLAEQMPLEAKRAAYRCDVTYGVGTDFGFDYLRDQLTLRAAGRTELRFHERLLHHAPRNPDLIQRELASAIIDEADSVLIDEARSPLIIAVGARRPHETPEVYRLADRVARQLAVDEHFSRERCQLTAAGEEHALELLADKVVPMLRRAWPHYVESALRARRKFRRDVHYVVQADKVVIVDEYTGRLCPDRTWRSGLHQAVEAAAGVGITDENASEATITRPSYFRLYQRVCGMTGTASEAAAELRRSYGLRTTVIPLHRPSRREVQPDRVFLTQTQKLAVVAREIWTRRSEGQPVLIGARTIENSEALAEVLAPLGFPFRLLNAKQDADEAAIVEQAGEPGAVTIATNMAGRGAHIPVPEESLRAGGLHVIGLERHESARIDRQLIGRTARQGQPGSVQFFLSLEDELLVRHSPEVAAALGRQPADKYGELSFRLASHFLQAQRAAERLDCDHRLVLARQLEWVDELKHAL